MALKPQETDASDASGRALAEGYVVVIPGARGRNSVVTDAKGNKVFTGRAPRGLLDLKAAVRYLRLFDKEMPGDAERIITDGTSAGGAMSSLLGATGNLEPSAFRRLCVRRTVPLDQTGHSLKVLYII